MSIRKIIAQIKEHDNFLITSHVNLEGDALGSELAFSRLIKALGKNAVIVNEDNPPYGYEFFPGVDTIRKYKDNLKDIKFDCFVALDCSDLKRTGEVYRLNSGFKPVLNIDHHISNVKFGQFNWIEPRASSCCEMIYELYEKSGVKIDKETALLLYAGIVADSGSFRYSNTSSRTHKIVSGLLKYGLDVVEVYKNLFGNIPLADMKLIAKVLNDIHSKAQGKIIWFQIKAAMLRKHKMIYADLTDYVLSFARAIKGAEVVVLFKENLGTKFEVRVNFRSQGEIDVNEIAKFFGGGGHKSASGCTIRGSIGQVSKKVLKKIDEALDG